MEVTHLVCKLPKTTEDDVHFTSETMASALKNWSNRSLLHLKICISFLVKLLKKNSRFGLPILWCGLLYHGVSVVAADEVSMSVKEGDLVTLHTDVKTNQQYRIRWYHYDTRIAEINGDLSKICTDVQCNEGTEIFRGRLKLDHQNGSLTIRNIRTTDAGDYLQISSGNNSNSEKRFNVTVHGFFSVSTDGVSVFVMERDSVTFQTGVKTNQQGRIRWYFNDTRIAQINGDLSKICTDVQCNEGTERFRGRLKLEHQTGSLIIMNITNTDAGIYELVISSKNRDKSDTTFHFAVHGVSAAELDEMKEGENVTLYTGVIKNPNDVMTWYFNDIPIAGDQSKICTDEQCDERFRDRLKVDHQTGSLTIMNITNTGSGDYQLRINSSRIIIVRKFTLTVPVATVRNPGPPSTAAGANAVVIGGVLLVAAVVVVAYYGRKRCTKNKNDTAEQRKHDEENGESENFLPGESGTEMNHVNGKTTDHSSR